MKKIILIIFLMAIAICGSSQEFRNFISGDVFIEGKHSRIANAVITSYHIRTINKAAAGYVLSLDSNLNLKWIPK